VTLRVHYVQHADGEGPGAVEHWARERGHELRGTHPYRGGPLPPAEDFDLLVVLGGGMNIYQTDRYPWLNDDRRLIAAAIAHGKPVLGICLGSQLVADVLGARVTRNPEPEIGWFPVELTEDASRFGLSPGAVQAYHWHEDTWSLPEGAVRLASSEGCPNQAFAYGDRVVGVQFHPEMTLEIARSIALAEGDALPSGRFVQTPAEMLADGDRFDRAHPLLRSILDALSARCNAP
jgi:GMP synthase-like glutamine amidotransferase